MSKNLALVFIALFVLVGCSKEESTQSVPSAVEAPAPAVSAAPVDEDDPAIVTADDLADKATEEISAANLEQQLDRLEKEIGSAE